MGKHAFIDGKNLLYRCIYANAESLQIVDKTVSLFLKIMVGYCTKVGAKHLHVFWDEDRDKVWRNRYYSDYKNRTDSTYVNDFKENLSSSIVKLKGLLKHLPIRQYQLEEQEADDLIYSASIVLSPDRIVIFSTDEDLTQIAYSFDHVEVYHHVKGILEKPVLSVVEMKCLIGDKSDSIVGYRGIGPVKAAKIINENTKNEFFVKNGSEIYGLNKLLIDLSQNPTIIHNKLYVARVLSENLAPNFNKFSTMCLEHKLGYTYQIMPIIKKDLVDLPLGL